MRIIRTLLILIFVILICVLYIQNQEIVNHVFKFKLNLPFFSYGPIGVYNVGIIGGAFVFGVFFTLIVGALRATGKSGEIKTRNKKIKELENEIAFLEKKNREKEMSSSTVTEDKEEKEPSSNPFSSSSS